MRVYAGLQVTVTHPELSLFAIHNDHGYAGILLSAEPNLFITAIRGYAKAIHLVSFLQMNLLIEEQGPRYPSCRFFPDERKAGLHYCGNFVSRKHQL